MLGEDVRRGRIRTAVVHTDTKQTDRCNALVRLNGQRSAQRLTLEAGETRHSHLRIYGNCADGKKRLRRSIACGPRTSPQTLTPLTAPSRPAGARLSGSKLWPSCRRWSGKARGCPRTCSATTAPSVPWPRMGGELNKRRISHVPGNMQPAIIFGRRCRNTFLDVPFPPMGLCV